MFNLTGLCDRCGTHVTVHRDQAIWITACVWGRCNGHVKLSLLRAPPPPPPEDEEEDPQ